MKEKQEEEKKTGRELVHHLLGAAQNDGVHEFARDARVNTC